MKRDFGYLVTSVGAGRDFLEELCGLETWRSGMEAAMETWLP